MGCNSIYGWAVSQKLPVNGFMWVEKTSHFNEDFIKSNNEESDEGYFLEVYIQYLKNCMPLQWFTLFVSQNENSKKSKNLQPTCMIKKNMPCT